MMGRFGSWIWWLAGVCLAFVFGRSSSAMEAQALYGVPVRPPERVSPDLTDEQRKKIDGLIDAYLASQDNPPKPTAEQQAKIDQYIKDWESKEFATREAASAELVKIGIPALPSIRKVLDSKDPEVAWRAKAAVEKIGDGPEVEGLRGLGWPAQRAVRERSVKDRKAMTEKASAAGEAEQAGKKEEAEKLRAEAKTLKGRIDALDRLAAKVAPLRLDPGTHMKEMVAPDPRPVPPDPPPPPPNFRR